MVIMDLGYGTAFPCEVCNVCTWI